MKAYHPGTQAAEAVSGVPSRPATAIVHDSPDARLVVFRIEPGQAVAPHSSSSTVLLSIVSGSGIVTGGTEERAVQIGDLIIYAPNEEHGMRAINERLVVLASIAPRPGGR